MLIKTNIFKWCIVILFTATVHSQNESANWYFGDNAGLNFNSSNPTPLIDGALNTKEGCATISDPLGNLLFYTDGKTVYDRNHNIMPNGTGLMGDSSSTESAIIIPKPGSSSKFYIFTTDKPSYFLTPNDPIDGLNFSEVDMQLNNGYGDIIVSTKNTHLITYNPNDAEQNEYKNSEKLTAVSHDNGLDVWVITQFMNKFYSFLVTPNGVETSPVVSTVTQTVFPRINDDGANITAIGYLKVSPDGKKIAIAHSSTSLGSPTTGQRKSGKVLIYDFNNSTGYVTNEELILDNTYPYGVEFSPNSKILYVTASKFDIDNIFISSDLLQYNLESNNIPNSKLIINTSTNVAGALQLAIDSKIYRAGYVIFGSGTHLSVINNPNVLSSSCNYSHNSVFLNNKTAQIGLPPFIQSIFKFSFNYENVCLNESTHFQITSEDPYDSVFWDFGDGTTSNLEEPIHNYSQAGIYTVSLTMTINGIDYEPLIKQVQIVEAPQVIQNEYELTECDLYDNNSNDGITQFNLQSANPYLVTNSASNFNVFYYNSLNEAINDINNTSALPNIYENQFNNELIYAKVVTPNTNCYNIANVRLKTTQAINLGQFYLESCDIYYTNTGLFNLNEIRNQILNTVNLQGQITINFYENLDDAYNMTNQLPDTYEANNSNIIIDIKNNNVCYGTGFLQLTVNNFPYLENQVIEVCGSNYPITIDSGLDYNLINDYSFSWNTNQTTSNISITYSGNYSVTVINNITNCNKIIYITVNNIAVPIIQDVIIEDFNITILLDNLNEDYLFAIDNPNGNFQTSNYFVNVSPGNHTIYIKDEFNCNNLSIPIKVIGFPKYFTPNNDNINDFWNVKGLDLNNGNPALSIYNRFGKLIYSFNPLNNIGWDGTYNNQNLPTDDYWFLLEIPNNEDYSGHFTLKR